MFLKTEEHLHTCKSKNVGVNGVMSLGTSGIVVLGLGISYKSIYV